MTTRVITTKRLVMTPHQLGDYAESAAMQADAGLMRFLGGLPLTQEASWKRLLQNAGMWALLGYGFWVVREQGSGAFVGELGFFEGKRTGIEGFDGAVEMGWVIAPAMHGKGYGTEAVTAALGWGAGRFSRAVAMIDPANAPSLALARRLGFHQFGAGRYEDEPVGLWEYFWPG